MLHILKGLPWYAAYPNVDKITCTLDSFKLGGHEETARTHVIADEADYPGPPFPPKKQPTKKGRQYHICGRTHFGNNSAI